MNNIYLIYLGVLYISIMILIRRANYPIYKAILPVYNILLFAKLLKIHFAFLILTAVLCLILPEARMFIMTMGYIFIPFMISYKYGTGLFYGIVMLVFPPIMPLYAWMQANYIDTTNGLR
ncbi:MAG: hypothetical protein IJ966_04150 [Bacilli bacterium]|nr:hypothetical protein [Bacilli bacterium]